jgi:ribosome biogenesis ATPase
MDSLSKHTKGALKRMAHHQMGRGGGSGTGSPTSRGAPRFSSGSPTGHGYPSFPVPGQNTQQDEGGDADPTLANSAAGGSASTPHARKRRRERDAGDGQQGGGAEGGPDGEGGDGGPILGVIPKITLEDLGGLQRELTVINELIKLPLQCSHLFSRLGADPPCGVLLHGPPGCGKTKLAHAIAGTLQVPLFPVSAPEIVSGISGDSEQKIRTLFLDAISVAPSIVFIDEIDTIAGRRESAQREMERRIVGQLLTCMDQLGQAWREHGKVVCVLGATNRPEAIDSALRRAGRFDREIPLGIPTLDERKSILEVLTKRLALEDDVDFHELAALTPGYVGADLHLLVKEASILAIQRMYKALEAAGELQDASSALLGNFKVSFTELKDAVKRVQPSAMREGFTTIPNVSWDDVGALEEQRAELEASILQPITAPKLHKRFGLDNPIGVLLYGPPGCGKTLVAKAIANQSGCNFISIKGPELLNKFVGESERSVRMVFARGRASAPCVLFFDELDALAPRRGSDRANPSSERVVNQLLTEMDGVEGREQVYVIGATNRPDMIDPAMLRPGRLDKLLYVPLPNPQQRASILRTVARKAPVSAEVDFEAIGNNSNLEGYSGADLAAVVREACLTALKEVYNSCTKEDLEAYERTGVTPSGTLPEVQPCHFVVALQKIRPSVSLEDRNRYAELHRQQLSKGGIPSSLRKGRGDADDTDG